MSVLPLAVLKLILNTFEILGFWHINQGGNLHVLNVCYN